MNRTTLILSVAIGLAAAGTVIIRRKKMQAAGAGMGGGQKPTLPVEGRVTSKFGFREAPAAGASTGHNGVDLSVPIGTEVRAPWDGSVVSTYSNNTGGLQMIVQHPNGYRTGYAHLSRLVADKGDQVSQGDVLALTGNSGITTGPHLHFTLTDSGGQKIDPESVFDFA